MKNNSGVIISGGSLTANDIAVGKNASINKSSQADNDSISAMQQLKDEVTKLITLMEDNKVETGKIDAAKIAEQELKKDTPNLIVVNSVLSSVIESIKAIGGVAGSALSVKNILEQLIF